MPSWLLITISVLLALTPVVIWGRLLLKKTDQARYVLIFIFIGGTLTVFPLMGLQALWERFPKLNFITLIEQHIGNAVSAAFLIIILLGMLEEIVKFLVVAIAHKKNKTLIQSINDALTFSIVAALGFSFAENIYYFTNIWREFGLVNLFSSFVFRSIFTTAGHMIFSGIMGYYFGIAIFAKDIAEQQHWLGKKMYLTRFFTKIFRVHDYEIFQQHKMLQGLFLATALHTIFNFFLELEFVWPVVALITASALFVYYLLHKKTGRLTLVHEGKTHEATIERKDEEVVIELLGMWTNQGKYQEVIDICDRLLKRDPDNNVVKLFREKARDNTKLRRVYESLKGILEKAPEAGQTLDLRPLTQENEGVVAEYMDEWFKKGDYKKVIDIANRLLERNPQSTGAEMILQKAFKREKLQQMFDSLKLLFEERV